mmetsp:Transcript_11097/g.45249  ORF Transcript_11097/g.45249 Transcript_11097/m.45249 type:complete len:314 (+) Transcript_11097:217-1158(+)
MRSATALVCLAALCVLVAAENTITYSDINVVPGVGVYPEGCVVEIPDGARVFQHDRSFTVQFEDGTEIEYEEDLRCRPDTLPARIQAMLEAEGFPVQQSRVEHGWQAWTTYYYKDGIDSFPGYFTVPDIPEETTFNQILYIFTGLQNINWIPEPNGPAPWGKFDIIQPVLELFGNEGWALQSWYVPLPGMAKTSRKMNVNAGDNIFGNMTLTGPSTWTIVSQSTETGESVTLDVTNEDVLASQPWAYTTLEVYNLDGCSQYPDNDILFTDMDMYNQGNALQVNWVAHTGQELVCGEQAIVNSPSNVTITFGTS